MAKVVKFGEVPAPEGYAGPDLPVPAPYEFPEKPAAASRYCAATVEKAVKLCEEFGATDAQLSTALNISRKAIERWREAYPDFAERLDEAKAKADARVERSLFERATGYTHPAKKVFQYQGAPVIVDYDEYVPPDLGAQQFWLARRDRSWQDISRVEHTGAGGAPLPIINITLNQGGGAPLEISANLPEEKKKESRPFLPIDVPPGPKEVKTKGPARRTFSKPSLNANPHPTKAPQRVRPPED